MCYFCAALTMFVLKTWSCCYFWSMREFQKNSWKVLWYTDIKFFHNLCNLKNSLNKRNSSVVLVLSILDILRLMRRKIKLSKQCVDQNNLYINYNKSIKVIFKGFFISFTAQWHPYSDNLRDFGFPRLKLSSHMTKKRKCLYSLTKGKLLTLKRKPSTKLVNWLLFIDILSNDTNWMKNYSFSLWFLYFS